MDFMDLRMLSDEIPPPWDGTGTTESILEAIYYRANSMNTTLNEVAHFVEDVLSALDVVVFFMAVSFTFAFAVFLYLVFRRFY